MPYDIQKPNVALNERVAREVMKWDQHDTYKHLWYPKEHFASPATVLPDFSGKIQDAWLVIEKLSSRFSIEVSRWNEDWKAGFYKSTQDGDHASIDFAEKPAEAICLAAIRACEARL